MPTTTYKHRKFFLLNKQSNARLWKHECCQNREDSFISLRAVERLGCQEMVPCRPAPQATGSDSEEKNPTHQGSRPKMVAVWTDYDSQTQNVARNQVTQKSGRLKQRRQQKALLVLFFRGDWQKQLQAGHVFKYLCHLLINF